MSDFQRVGLQQIAKHFEQLEDPRSDINLRHPLVSVVVISLMAVLAGASGPTAIARWALLKQSLLLHALHLPNGIPAKDVFRRVLALLKPAAFQACFVSWIGSLRAIASEALPSSERDHLAVDGKTARHSYDRQQGLGALHSVSVWASELGLSLAQVACAEKSNEITAIPEVLRLVDIQGAIITIDAMGTQKAIAEQIIDSKADYVLALKANHEKMHQGVIDYIDKMIASDFTEAKVCYHLTEETGHGREEVRSYMHIEVPDDLPGREQWKNLKSLGVVVTKCIRNGKETMETRYYLSSLEVEVKQFAKVVRNHWGIENGCHWILDMVFREDDSRIREKHLRENFAWLNRFALNLLKQHPGKESIAMKRRSCGWSDGFLLEVLTGITL